MMNIQKIREYFPILETKVNGKPFVYFDNAATSQIPRPVIEDMTKQLTSRNANIHRGVYTLSEQASQDYESARKYVAQTIHASSPEEIVFTNGTTDSIALVSASLKQNLIPGDEIVTTIAEHHSNFVPWQQCAQQSRSIFKVAPITNTGEIDLKKLNQLLSKKTRLLAVSQCSNVLGILNDIPAICELAHQKGIPVLVDGAQGIVHNDVNVQQLDCDYYCFSGHKLMSIGGIGVLYAKKERLEQLHPLRYGGGMVKDCSIYNSILEDLPYRLEGGTPNLAGAVSLESALKFRKSIGITQIQQYETDYLNNLQEKLQRINGVRILGKTNSRTACISFTIKNIHPFDAATILDQYGIAVRSGHHCAIPLLHALGVEHAIRISPAFFNTAEEADYFIDILKHMILMLGGKP